jgi:hypothetical protein
MQTPRHAVSLEEQIEQWRSYLRRRQATHSVDVAELENHLRQQIAGLVDAGLATDEAFLIAVKRMGSHDALSEFARAFNRSQSLMCRGFRELRVCQTDVIVAFCLAVAAAVAIKVPALFGLQLDEHKDEDVRFYVRNASLLVLPLLTIYFAWKRRIETRTLSWLGVAFIVGGVFANVYPFAQASSTEVLTALHLPIALWLVVGTAYASGRWSQVDSRASSDSRGSCSLLRPDRPRRRRPHGVHGDDLPGHRDQRRAVHRSVAAALRSGRRCPGRILAGGSEAKRDRKHGADVDASVYADVRHHADHVSGDPAMDRARFGISGRCSSHSTCFW